MLAIHLVKVEETSATVISSVSVSPGTVWRHIVVSAMQVIAIGTWLVWFSAFIRHNLQEGGVREACQRAMPETADRCFDTVIIQRGGIRR